MYVIEFISPHQLAGIDEGDAGWQRYQLHAPFDTFEAADVEALWLSHDDSQYVYRVIELAEAAA
jgi:hypothetical protein